MPTSTVNWLWFGNQPLLDSSPKTNISNAEKDALIGYHATGSTELKAVAVTGDYEWGSVTQKTNGFATHWAGYTGSPIRIPTDFSYTVNGTSVSDIHAISAFSATIKIQTGANPDIFETQTATVIQMANGDLFLRPRADYVDQWDLFVSVYSIEVTATSTSYSAFNHTVGFKPSIFDVTFPCFVKGTMITTPRGDVPVEALKVGDLVSTSCGVKVIRWIGSNKFGASELKKYQRLLPIKLSAGSLGECLPLRDVYVSQQHRILVRSKIALSIFGTEEVLVAAKHLLAVDGIDVAVECAEVEYFHFALDNHSIVFANGIEAESLYLGTQALRMLSEESRRELSLIFPEVEGNLPVAQAATFASGRKARSLAARHQQNRRSLVSRPEGMLHAASERAVTSVS